MASTGIYSSQSKRDLAMSCTKPGTWWQRTGTASTEFLVFRFENWTDYSVGLIVYFLMGNVPELDPEDNVYLQQGSVGKDMF
jgi:hypothetical protein